MKRTFSLIVAMLASLALDAFAQGLAPDCAAIRAANPAAADGDYIISVGSSRVDLQACKLEYSIVSPK